MAPPLCSGHRVRPNGVGAAGAATAVTASVPSPPPKKAPPQRMHRSAYVSSGRGRVNEPHHVVGPATAVAATKPMPADSSH